MIWNLVADWGPIGGVLGIALAFLRYLQNTHTTFLKESEKRYEMMIGLVENHMTGTNKILDDLATSMTDLRVEIAKLDRTLDLLVSRLFSSSGK